MANLEFDEEAAAIQEAASNTHSFCEQRKFTLDALALTPGERVLDIGAGTGHFVADMAHATAGKNEIVGLDILSARANDASSLIVSPSQPAISILSPSKTTVSMLQFQCRSSSISTTFQKR